MKISNLSPPKMHLDIEIKKQQENGSIENRIEPPSPNSITPTIQKMKQKHTHMAQNITTEKNNLTSDHKGETSTGQTNGSPKSVAINKRVNRGGNENGKNLKRLREFEPEEGHEDENGVVEEAEEGEVAGAEDGEEGAESVEEAGEVEEVGPEEDAAGRAGAEGETEEPLERGFGAGPEPAGVADLGGGGEEEAGEDGGGDEGHGEGVEGGEGTQGEGTAEGEEREEEREEEVGGDGAEEEGPGGAPGLGVAPPEIDDRGVLGEVIG
ncbi:unnamed protein product [Camellia sinensis]